MLSLCCLLIGCTSNGLYEDIAHGQSPALEPLFTLIDTSASGVNFINQITDEAGFNILTYRNFYNGGGVAIGDINNDSLADIYFTSNQHQNKLYLNKGNFVFEDITQKAGVGGTKPWSTGVAMADVNGDGLLDIYVCNSGDVNGTDKKNELFINNGDLTFSEKADEYNLNDEGYSTHAAFFDYDLDGDLDCYILNNSFKEPGKIELYIKMREVNNYLLGDKLMRNDNGIFRDVTRQSGIFSSEIGFGLGVAVGDVNADHLPDIYISNDFWERDYLYINKGNGKFSEDLINRINYCSVSSMGADIADINNDGSPEIFTTDMLPGDNRRLKTNVSFDPYHLEDLKYRANYHYQMIQNCLHLNDGSGKFQEIALLSGVAATDWSWGALIFDFENDGNKDIFASNGIARDINSLDFRDFLSQAGPNAVKTAETNEAGYHNIISKIPSLQISNYAFINRRNLRFTNAANKLGLAQPSFSNGAAYGDLDNDGDADLVVNNVNSAAFIYRNNTHKSGNHFLKVRFKGYGKNPFGIGAAVTVKTKSGIQYLENFTNRGFESSIEPQLLFGLGKEDEIETLQVVWPDRKAQVLQDIRGDQVLILDHNNAAAAPLSLAKKENVLFSERSSQLVHGNAVHKESRYNDFDYEVLLPHMLSTEGPRIVVGDVNGDKLEDFVLLGSTGDPNKLFLQEASGEFNFKSNDSFNNDTAFESTCGDFFDYDFDGDLDLMIGSGGNEIGRDKLYFIVRLYINDGKGNFIGNPDAIPPAIGNFSTLEAEDFDGDGDSDIFLGARNVPGNYGLKPRSYLLRNDNGIWTDIATPELGNVGMVTDACWADTDNDGDKDLVVVGDWMSITVFRNVKGVLDQSKTIANSSGWWRRIEMSDLDADGDADFVAGNWGLNTKFNASAKRPLEMFVKDFDDNGKSEFVINWYPPLDSVPYPFPSKQELTFQLPALRKSILRYDEYAGKTYSLLFSESMRRNAISYKAEYMESAVLWNEGNDNFTLTALPVEAQVSPVFGIVADDLDGDAQKDIWLGGNFYGLKPQAGRHDASRGVYLKGLGKRKFELLSPSKTGIYVEGEVRDAVMTGAIKKIIVARNNAKVLIFQKTH